MRCLRASHGYSAMCCSYYTKLNGGKGQSCKLVFFRRVVVLMFLSEKVN